MSDTFMGNVEDQRLLSSDTSDGPPQLWPWAVRRRRLGVVTDPAEKLYEDALALPEDDREALAMRILATVPRTAAPNPSSVVREADSVIQKVGVLRTTESGNALVDELLSTHTKGLAVRRPLERRLKK